MQMVRLNGGRCILTHLYLGAECYDHHMTLRVSCECIFGIPQLKFDAPHQSSGRFVTHLSEIHNGVKHLIRWAQKNYQIEV